MLMPDMPLEPFELAAVAAVVVVDDEGTVRFLSALAQPASRVATAAIAAVRAFALPNLWRPNILAPPWRS